MNKVTIEILTDNDAFTENPVGEVRRILQGILARNALTSTRLFDLNGHSVGKLTVEEDDNEV